MPRFSALAALIATILLATILFGRSASAQMASKTVVDWDHDPTLQSEPFYGHLTQSARTVGHGVVSFQPYPGDNLTEQSFLWNTLSVGVGSRFELGSIPYVYFQDAVGYQAWNVTMKANLFASKKFDVGLGVTHLDSKYPAGSDIKIYQLSQFALMSNYRISKIYQLGANMTSSWIHHFAYKNTDESINNAVSPFNYLLDLSVRTAKNFYVIPGVSRMFFVNGAEQVSSWGAGLSVTWLRPRKFFASPTLGVHRQFATQTTQFQFGTSFD